MATGRRSEPASVATRCCMHPRQRRRQSPGGTRPAPSGAAPSGDAIGASRPQGARCKRRRLPRSASPGRCCSPRAGSTPSSGCVAGGRCRDSRGVLALPASPSAGVAPIRRRPSRPSPDRGWRLSRSGGIARSKRSWRVSNLGADGRFSGREAAAIPAGVGDLVYRGRTADFLSSPW